MSPARLHRLLVALVLTLLVCTLASAETLIDVTGTWDTNWGEMYVFQIGHAVTAQYTWDRGRIDGALDGLTLTGTWAEDPTYAGPHDAGGILFEFSPDGSSFSGTWGYDTSSTGGDWTGTKTSDAAPLHAEELSVALDTFFGSTSVLLDRLNALVPPEGAPAMSLEQLQESIELNMELIERGMMLLVTFESVRDLPPELKAAGEEMVLTGTDAMRIQSDMLHDFAEELAGLADSLPQLQ